MNLNLVRVLSVLLAERSVSRAAARLGVTQSAVSHALSQLRQLLGDPLLVRGAAGMVPTPRAEQLAPRVARALDDLERALGEAAAFEPTTAVRSFTLAAGDHMAGILLQAIVWMGLREAPGVSIRVVPFHAARVALELERGDVDIAIGPPFARDADLRQKGLFRDRICCVVRKDHTEIQGKVDLDQLRRCAHVVMSREDESLRRVDDALRDHGVERRVAVELPYFLLAPALVPFADLVLLAPYTLGALFAQGYPLQVLELPIELPSIQVNAYWHPRADADAAHVWLRQQVRRCVDEFFRRTRILVQDAIVGVWPELEPDHRA
jgi:DNA-binding transcriptional LysR family regulator